MRNRKNRSLRWRVPFKTIKERDAMICIYDENYHGDVIDLEAAENPIETEDNNSEELLSPIRSQTGYLRIIDNGDIAGLMPSDNMNHYVELYVGDVLEWCGYMQADSFSEDWDATPIEVEFPLISGIGVLEGLYLDQSLPFGDITLAAMLKECFDMASIDYDKVYIPAEVFIPGERCSALLRLQCSRFNFFNESGDEYDDVDYQKYEPWDAYEVITEICKFFGWTLYERKNSLYIVNHGGNGMYHRIPYSDFGTSQVIDGVSINKIDLFELEFDGDTHSKDVLQGYNLFKISEDINAVGDVVPMIDEDALGRKGLLTIDYETSTGFKARQEKIKIFGGGSVDSDTEMCQYEASVIGTNPETNEEIIDIKPIPFNEKLYAERLGACFGEYDLYEMSDIPNKRNYDYKKSVILTLRDKERHGVPALSDTKYPLIKMRNGRCARYNSGAFVFSISGSTCILGLRQQSMNTQIHAFDFVVRMQCGVNYWDGKQWTKQPSHFKVHVNEQGKIDSTKTLAMPYNGAEGYIMPIDKTLSGNVELTLYANGDYGFGKEADRIYIEGLKVEYFADDNDTNENDSEPNKYQSMSDAVFQSKLEVSLKIATNNKNKAGYALLTKDGDYIQELQYADNSQLRPENFLLSKLKRIYGRNIEKLSIEVEKTNLLPCDVLQNNGHEYAMTSCKTNWSEEHQTITIMDVV